MAPSPHGHFLFLPSDNNCLLLKSIAVSELMLPRDVPPPMEGLNDGVLSVVTSCLDQVEFGCLFVTVGLVYTLDLLDHETKIKLIMKQSELKHIRRITSLTIPW